MIWWMAEIGDYCISGCGFSVGIERWFSLLVAVISKEVILFDSSMVNFMLGIILKDVRTSCMSVKICV
jgi:hypothetical protein